MYLYFLKKVFHKRAAFMIFIAALLPLSCSQPGNSTPGINAQTPVITDLGGGGAWDVSKTDADTFSLSVTAESPDEGSLSYQWFSNVDSNVTAAGTGGTAISEKTNSPALTLSNTDYASDGERYFYAVVTNTIEDNGDGGKKTAAAVSDVITVNVTNNQPIYITQSNINEIGADLPLSGTYILDTNITLSDWVPIGNDATPFRGTFDGNGNTITLNSFAGDAVSGNSCFGIFGYVRGDSVSAMAVIKNIKLSGSVNFSSENTIYMGGIAGIIDGAGTLITNCNSSLTMDIKPGNGGQTVFVNQPYNYIGGLIGMFRNGAGIESCHNSGDVTADNIHSPVSGQVFAGGIAGGSFYVMNPNYQGYIQNSSSTGNITGMAQDNWTFAGGIAGTITGGNINSPENTTRIVRCFSTGTISVENTSSAYCYAGGIVGYNYYGALVSQSYFNGNVNANKAGDYTGGIAGYNSQTNAPNNSRIEDCWSAGMVTGFNNAGGIVGQNQINTYIRRCYSTAAVSASNSANASTGGGVGGIAGVNASTVPGGAITACVALNPSLSALSGNDIHRIAGTSGGNRSNNYARQDMTISTSGTYKPAKSTDGADGADTIAMPPQTFYAGLGWDFTNVWAMSSSDSYPKLKWQNN